MSGQPTSDDKPGPAAGAPAETAGTTGGEPAAATPEAAAQVRIAELEGQIADLTDRLLRTHAEMDNIRKRGEKEKTDTQKYAVTRFAADVLAIGDNLQRAMSAVPAGAADADPALKVLVDGVSMTEREFLNVLVRHGVTPIAAMGETFNPHQHQAVMEQQNPDVPAGSVMQLFQEGYMIEDRVLRPAMVVVAKGGFKPVKSGAPSSDPAMPKADAKSASEDDPAAPQPTAGSAASPRACASAGSTSARRSP